MSKQSTQAIDEILGRNLKRFRQVARMSQENLGATIGVTFQQVQKYEFGVNRISAAALFAFSKALGVPMERFYEGAQQ